MPRSCRPMNAASSRSRTRAANSTCASISSSILFIIFDLEVAFLFPWAVTLGRDRPVRLLVDDGVPRRADGRLHLRMEEGSARMGVSDHARSTGRRCRPARARTRLLRRVDRRAQDKGFIVAQLDKLVELGAHRLAVADDLRPGLLRRRDDAHGARPLRPRPLRHRSSGRARASPT